MTGAHENNNVIISKLSMTTTCQADPIRFHLSCLTDDGKGRAGTDFGVRPFTSAQAPDSSHLRIFSNRYKRYNNAFERSFGFSETIVEEQAGGSSIIYKLVPSSAHATNPAQRYSTLTLNVRPRPPSFAELELETRFNRSFSDSALVSLPLFAVCR